MLANQIAITPPADPYDGWFLKQQINAAAGITDCHRRLSYDGTNLLFVTDNLTPQQATDAETAVAAYVHPPDTTKDLRLVMLQGMMQDADD